MTLFLILLRRFSEGQAELSNNSNLKLHPYLSFLSSLSSLPPPFLLRHEIIYQINCTQAFISDSASREIE